MRSISSTQERNAAGRARRLLTAGLTVLIGLGTAAVVSAAPAAAAVSLAVTTTADIAANGGDCGNTSTTVPSPLSLREATCIATNYGASQPVTINIPAGHYTLTSGELQPGKVLGSNVSLVGASAASTTIDGYNNSRVLDFDSNLQGGVTNAVSNLTITGGKDDTFGGAGIIAGSNLNSTADTLTLNNVVVTGNHANVANPGTTNRGGGGIQFEGGKLTITNSTISGNSAGSSQGAGLYYLANGAASPESLTITGTTFSGNTALGSSGDTASLEGGALTVSGTSSSTYTVTNSTFTGNTDTADAGSGSPVGGAIFEQSGNLTVTGSTFTGNSASGGNGSPAGGAIDVMGSATAALHYNRFTGNTSPTGSAVAAAPSINATENWWGCSAGAGQPGCDTATVAVTVNPRLVLTASASPAHVVGPNGAATLTASLLTDSAGGAVSASNLAAAFDGLPVSFADPAGDATVTTTAGAHTVNLAGGLASIDYHSNTTLGPDNDSVTLDNGTVTDVLEVDQPPAITSANTAHFNIGQAGSYTVASVGYPNAALLESGTLPAGLTFHDDGNGSATISGTPSGAGGTYPLTVTANNGYAPNATQTLTLSLGQPPAFTSGSTATFVTGQAGSFTVTTAGVPTVSSITESGTLPAGVTFTDNGNGTATIAGTPTGAGGTYPVTLTAVNGVAPNATQNVTVQVNQAPSVQSNPADQTVQPGTSVSFTASASGVPTPTVQWQRSTDGGASFINIAGATSTTYTFTAALSDDGNQYRAVFGNGVGSPVTTTAATVNVGTAPAFTSADHASFVVGQAGTFSITISGAPSATLSRTGAQFPAWLTLTDNGDGTGELTGTPPAGSGGQYSLMLKAANGYTPSASQVFTLSVDQSPAITSGNHATFTAGQAGSFAVTTNAGFPTDTTVTENGTLPSGVTFHDNGDGTGALAGTPTAGAGGTYPVTFTATATGGLADPATQTFTLTVLAPPSITSADHATFSAGATGNFTVTTTAGNPATTTLSDTGTLPAGVSFTDNGDGTASLSGTPNLGSGGVYTITVTASNGVAPDATQTFTLTVNEPPHITSADHATLTATIAGSFTVTAAGGQPSAITLTETGWLPAGVTFVDNGDGTATLAGRPSAGTGGSYPVTVTASNGVLPDATQSLTLVVGEQPTIMSLDFFVFHADTAGSYTVTTAGGYPAATTMAEDGPLPAGVTFTDNGDGTATFAGTPAAGTGGSYPVTVTADNGVIQGTLPRAWRSFTIVVQEPARITSADRATFTADSNGSFTVTTSHTYPGPVTLSETGWLPPGVTFSDNGDGTATLSGRPTIGGVYPLTITAAEGPHTDATQSFTATVTALPDLTSADHTSFTTGTAGTFTVTTAAGTPAATTLTENGALPAGVTFTDNGDGTATLAGTPAAGSGGWYPITVLADNGTTQGSLAHAVQSFTLAVLQPAVITSADHTTFSAGASGSFTVTTAHAFPAPAVLTETGTLPAGVTFTDNGDGTATLAGTPAGGSAGTYALHITTDNGVGNGDDQLFTLIVGRKSQTITVTSPDPGTGTVGGTYTPAATADSTLPVTYSIDAATTNHACSFDGTTVSFDHAGTCVIDFDQAGDGTYAAADQAQASIVVATVATTATATPTLPDAVYGQAVTVTAAVTAGQASPAGTVQFAVDGTDAGQAVQLANGSATSPALSPWAPGVHTVTATFTPTDASKYAPSTATTTFTVAQAATTTTLTLGQRTVTAAVAPTAPGAGIPTGTVTFTVGGHQLGTATLVHGAAMLQQQLAPGSTRNVAATYSGDSDFTGSSASTSRHDPHITATVTSPRPKSRSGWYRTPVTVRFTCTTDGAPLTRSCPAPVHLTRNAAARSVTRTVTATDGGAATVTVTGINIDRTAPTVRIAGVRNGALYAGPSPKPTCEAHDALSGALRCALTSHTVHGLTTVRATVTDRAGNAATTTVSYQVLGIYLAGARYEHGAFEVRAGHGYTLVALGSVRPQYYDAAVYPNRPGGPDVWFHHAGHNRWALGVTVQREMRSHPMWNFGVKVGAHLYVLRVRMT